MCGSIRFFVDAFVFVVGRRLIDAVAASDVRRSLGTSTVLRAGNHAATGEMVAGNLRERVGERTDGQGTNFPGSVAD